MTNEPWISPEVFDFLQHLGIEPYTKLDRSVREQLGDGVRLLRLFDGECFITPRPGIRLTVLSGQVRLDPLGSELTLDSTRQHTVLTQPGENRIVAKKDAVLLIAEAGFLDTLAAWAELAAYAGQSGETETLRRLLAVRHTVAFNRVAVEYVLEALRLMVPRPVKAGETIVTQGEPGDAFYLLWSGRAEVWKSDIYDDKQKLVDTIGPMDTFGDDALIVSGNRNATVRMIEDGELLVLAGQQFQHLLSRPLIDEVDTDVAADRLADGWRSLDVRYEEEFADGHIADALHLPLHELRQRADQMLDREARYVAVCLSGKRSAVATFLLKQRGFTVCSMKGGMGNWTGPISDAI